MRRRDARDHLAAGRFVEHRAAAAIDLYIDEAGREMTAREVVLQRTGGDLRRRDDAGDPLAVDENGVILQATGGCMNAAICQGEQAGVSESEGRAAAYQAAPRSGRFSRRAMLVLPPGFR